MQQWSSAAVRQEMGRRNAKENLSNGEAGMEEVQLRGNRAELFFLTAFSFRRTANCLY